MRHFVPGTLALLCLCPLAGFAHAAEPRFAYCSVNDTGGHNIWVSQIFPAPPNTDPMGNDLATEFHRYVGTLGGSGDKSCVVAPRQALEDLRVKIAGIMGRRAFGIRVYKWHDVQWTPSEATYAGTTPAPIVASDKYVYCRMTDADARKQVTSGVFVSKLPPMNDGEHYAALTRYARAFGRSAAASHGVAPDALCIASDTQAEADKSRNDYRHAFPFSGIKIIEMPWAPDPALASSPVAAAQRSAPVAPVSANPAAGANRAADDALSRRIATEKFFRIPAGASVPIEHSGTRMVGTVPVAVTTKVQRVADGNQCRVHTDSTAGKDRTAAITTVDGSSWAGLLPLESTIRSRSAYGATEFTARTIAIDALQGQPFPLVEGNTFGFTFTQRTSHNTDAPSDSAISEQCVVGASGPADAGMSGDRTGLQCTLAFSNPALKPRRVAMHWYSAVGCFAQDAGSP